MKRLAIEILILILVGVGSHFLFTGYLYPLMDMPSNGPVPVRTIIMVLIITVFFKKSGHKWSDFGFKWPFKWWVLISAVLGFLAFKLLAMQPFNDWLRQVLALAPNDYSFFEHIEGNTAALVLWLLVAWVSAGFGEEMVFRGYLMQRVAQVFGGTKKALIIGLFVQAMIFGLGHAYAGWGAAVLAMTGALATGAFVIITKRSIWPAIIVHGLWDSLAVILFYSQGSI
ncbi:MAG: CPBP family intramembrane metalloprotease [Roseivirga sp.]|nr:CPBP family intramembrane metalloprotease [Roseivirga sp.]